MPMKHLVQTKIVKKLMFFDFSHFKIFSKMHPKAPNWRKTFSLRKGFVDTQKDLFTISKKS